MRYARNRLWMLLLLALPVSVVACDDNDTTEPITVDETQLLVDHLEANSDAHPSDWIASASAVREAITVAPDDNLVIDIRAADAYDTGHIDGAVNMSAGDLPTYLASMDAASYDNIFVVCYSGQSAAFAVGALRAAGYDNVVSMKWGMSSWHTDFAGSWNQNIGSGYRTEFVTTASPAKAPAGELPVLSTGHEDPEAILTARVAQVFADGFGQAAISIGELWPDRDDFYIVNYWPEADYLGMGHLPGAVNYEPATKPWLQANDLTTLPTDQPIVVYCYTGQGSAFLAGYLRVMGYDVKSLKFGANGMIHAAMTKSTWAESQVMDYSYVPTS